MSRRKFYKKDVEKYWTKEGIKCAQQRRFIIKQLVDMYGAYCGLCGEEITDLSDCTIDHIRPVSKGGETSVDNCQLAHSWCNQAKGDAW